MDGHCSGCDWEGIDAEAPFGCPRCGSIVVETDDEWPPPLVDDES